MMMLPQTGLSDNAALIVTFCNNSYCYYYLKFLLFYIVLSLSMGK